MPRAKANNAVTSERVDTKDTIREVLQLNKSNKSVTFSCKAQIKFNN